MRLDHQPRAPRAARDASRSPIAAARSGSQRPSWARFETTTAARSPSASPRAARAAARSAGPMARTRAASASSPGLPVTASADRGNAPATSRWCAATRSKTTVRSGRGKPRSCGHRGGRLHLVPLVQVVQPAPVDEAVLDADGRDAAPAGLEHDRAAPAAGFGVGQDQPRASQRPSRRRLRPSRAPTTGTAAWRCRCSSGAIRSPDVVAADARGRPQRGAAEQRVRDLVARPPDRARAGRAPCAG